MWGVEINVGKSGIMHMRKRSVERCQLEYEVDGDTYDADGNQI